MLDVWQIQMIQTSKEKMQCQICRNVPNGWEVLPASWFSRTNSSSNDGPALVIWLRSDMVPFLASSCQFSPMAFLGFDSNTTNQPVKQKVKQIRQTKNQKKTWHSLQPVQPCFWRRKIVFDPADVMKARNTSSSTSPQHASLCILTTPPSLPPFWKRGSTERKRFKTGPKKKWKHWTLTAALQYVLGSRGCTPPFGSESLKTNSFCRSFDEQSSLAKKRI